MILDTIFGLFDISLEVASVVDSGLVEVGLDPLTGSTTVALPAIDLVEVDLTQGVAVDTLGSDVLDLGLTEEVTTVNVADELVGLNVAEGAVSAEVGTTLVEVAPTEGVAFGIGEELLYADLTEGVAIAPSDLLDFGIAIPTALDTALDV